MCGGVAGCSPEQCSRRGRGEAGPRRRCGALDADFVLNQQRQHEDGPDAVHVHHVARRIGHAAEGALPAGRVTAAEHARRAASSDRFLGNRQAHALQLLRPCRFAAACAKRVGLACVGCRIKKVRQEVVPDGVQ